MISLSRAALICCALLALPIAGCTDRPTAPTTASRLESVSGDDQPGFVGIPLDERLVVRVLDADNQPVPDQLVVWSVVSGGGSVTPVQSRSDASGIARTTWTLGLTAGPQEARASIPGLEAVSFSATAAQLDETCDGNPLDLAVGGSVLLVGNQSSELCLQSSTLGTRDFVVVAFNSNRPPAEVDVVLQIEGNGIVPIVGPPSPSVDVAQTPAPDPTNRRDDSFDAKLRDIELRELAPRVIRGALPGASHSAAASIPGPSFSLSNPVIGETITINAQSAEACSQAIEKQGRVMAISQRAIVLADLANPSGGFTTAEYQSIAATFDTLVYPVDAEFFGEPEDIDNNNRIVLFYTMEVNKITPTGGGGGFVAGFFFARDLFPRTGNGRLNACPTSNQSEILYLMVPDPEGTINGNVRDKSFVMRRTTSTMAHEMVHLVNASLRLYVNLTAKYPERGWLEEGLAHSAEEQLFFHRTGFQTRSEINASTVQQSANSISAYNDFQADNAARLRDFLSNPNINWAPNNNASSLAARGASTYFLRYLVDRHGGNEAATFRALVSSADTGMRNLEGVIQADPVQWMRDYLVALYVDDAVANLPDRYRVLTWNQRSVFATLFPGSTWALRPTALNNSVFRSASVQQSGGVYYRFGLAAGGEAQLTIDASAGEQFLSVVVLRTR